MNLRLLLAAGTMGALMLTAAPAMAFIINFDENGNASGTNDAGAAFSETGTPIANGGVAYALPVLVVAGTVGILDTGGGLSDILDFVDTTGQHTGNVLDFFSLDCTGAMADTCGINPVGTIDLVGATEATNGSFIYNLNISNTYNGQSDPSSVPEPASLALLGAGLAALGAMRRKRKAS